MRPNKTENSQEMTAYIIIPTTPHDIARDHERIEKSETYPETNESTPIAERTPERKSRSERRRRIMQIITKPF